MSVHNKVRSQFALSAKAYVNSKGHAKGADLQLMLEQAGNIKGKKVLDIATGGGHTALAFAKVGAKVTAIDLTPEMLTAAKAFIESEGYHLEYQASAAENLSFAKGIFDIVTCRIAAHHFADPRRFLLEAQRVLKPQGLLLLNDNITPEPPELGKIVNHIEKVRDPSHVEAYSVKIWVEWLTAAGFDVIYLSRWKKPKDYAAWFARMRQPAEVQKDLEQYVLRLPENVKTYLDVEEQDGKLISLSHEGALFTALRLDLAQP